MKTIFVLSIILCIAIGTTEIVRYIQFDRGCEGYLKRAADANTVALAKRELAIAVKYMEDNKMTSGFTSIVYNTPDEDIGYWYENLSESLKELNDIKKDAITDIEKNRQSNTLKKLRETILDDTKNGVEVTSPSGISRYPYNGLFAFLMGLSIAGMTIGWLYMMVKSR